MSQSPDPKTQHRTGTMAQIPSLGAGYVPAYQLSADPYFKHLTVTSSISTEINFPYVTRFLQVTNYTSGSEIRIGVTENGVTASAGTGIANGGTYFVLSGAAGAAAQPTTFGPFDIRTKRLHLIVQGPLNPGSAVVGVFAGLTTVPQKNMVWHTSSEGWEGVG